MGGRSIRPADDRCARGNRGCASPFGGYKGANIALIVELLAAGLSGSSWSMDGADFLTGDRSPDTGMTIIAIAPTAAVKVFQNASEHMSSA